MPERMALEVSSLSTIISGLISILLVSLAIHFGAKPFAKAEHESFWRAIVVAVVGSLFATLVALGMAELLPGEILPLIVSLAAWALVAAIVYRVTWLRGVLIGILAWLLWFVVNLLIGLIFGA